MDGPPISPRLVALRRRDFAPLVIVAAGALAAIVVACLSPAFVAGLVVGSAGACAFVATSVGYGGGAYAEVRPRALQWGERAAAVAILIAIVVIALGR
jgi:hypothetical protein